MPAMEAMACGAALVTYDNGGCRDYAVDGLTALVAPRRDVAALAKALGRAVGDRTLRQRLAGAGHALVTREFDWDRAAERLEAALAGAVGSSGERVDRTARDATGRAVSSRASAPSGAFARDAARGRGCGRRRLRRRRRAPESGPPGRQSDRAPLRLMLSSDRPAYAVGQPVTLTLVVENIGPAPAVSRRPAPSSTTLPSSAGTARSGGGAPIAPSRPRSRSGRSHRASAASSRSPGARPRHRRPGRLHCRGGADGWAPAGRPAAPSRHCRPLTARAAAAGKPAVRQIRLAAVPCEAIEPQTGFRASVGYAEAARVVAVKLP